MTLFDQVLNDIEARYTRKPDSRRHYMTIVRRDGRWHVTCSHHCQLPASRVQGDALKIADLHGHAVGDLGPRQHFKLRIACS